MLLAKRLAFAPLFLIFFSYTCFKLSTLLASTNILFSFDLQSIIDMLLIPTLFLVSSLFYILFATFAGNWRLVLPIILVSATLPFVFIPQPLSFILTVGFSTAMLLTFLNLEKKLKTYITFQPSTLLAPSIKTFATLLILISSFGFYLSSSAQIKKDGFSLPDSLTGFIDTAVGLMSQQALGSISQVPGEQTDLSQVTGLPQIDTEKLELLKNNPGLLQQFGIDPSILDSLEQAPDQSINVTKEDKSSNKSLSSSLVNVLIKPYESFIPPFMAVTLFFTLTTITSIWGMFLSPLLWIIFGILTKTGFASFTTEMREVKKLVI